MATPKLNEQPKASGQYGSWTFNPKSQNFGHLNSADTNLVQPNSKKRHDGQGENQDIYNAFLFDMDGVISNAAHRQHFLKETGGRTGLGTGTEAQGTEAAQKKKPEKEQTKKSVRKKIQDWNGFFEAAKGDPPISRMVEMMKWLDPKYHIVLLTARPYRIYDLTVEWLIENDIRWDLLVMRGKENNESTQVFKERAVKSLYSAGFRFVLGFEDDPKNIEVFENRTKMGDATIPTVYIHSGYYD